jgi:DNA damage-binding protein 1
MATILTTKQAEGSVYLFGSISPQYQDLLINFQTRVTGHIETLGDIKFEDWRAYRTEARESDGPFRFLDGEILSRFLDMPEKMQDEVCEGLGPSTENMRNIVEELRRLHR